MQMHVIDLSELFGDQRVMGMTKNEILNLDRAGKEALVKKLLAAIKANPNAQENFLKDTNQAILNLMTTPSDFVKEIIEAIEAKDVEVQKEAADKGLDFLQEGRNHMVRRGRDPKDADKAFNAHLDGIKTVKAFLSIRDQLAQALRDAGVVFDLVDYLDKMDSEKCASTSKAAQS